MAFTDMNESVFPQVNKNMDFGFSILEKMPDGALPQLLPYQYVLSVESKYPL
jgi:hypothetical protein